MLKKLDKMIDVNLPSIAMLIESGDRFSQKRLQILDEFKEFEESDDEDEGYLSVGGATGLLIGVAQNNLINSPAIKMLQSNKTNSEFIENLEAFDEEFEELESAQELKGEILEEEEKLNINENMDEAFNDITIRNEFKKYATKHLIMDELNFFKKYQIYKNAPSDELEVEIINRYITGNSPISVSYKLKTKMEVLIKKGEKGVALELIYKEVPFIYA
jgi:hypothetical protein